MTCPYGEMSWKLCVVLSQISIAHGMLSSGFVAKKNFTGAIGSPYKIIPETRSTLEGLANCLKDTGYCSSFSFDRNEKRTLLYTLSLQPQRDYAIWPADRCPYDRGCLYSKQFDYVLYVNEQEEKLWEDAEIGCRLGGGELVSLDTEDKFAHVKHLLDGQPHTYWLGGRMVSGIYRWMNGKAMNLNSTYWHPEQPRDERPYISTGGKYFGSFGMDDEFYNKKHYFICEY